MLELCRRAQLPAPEVNVHVEGHTVDFAWAAERLIVETDGWQAHGTRPAFERDRGRDADLLVAGWRVLRFTHTQVERRHGWVAQRLAQALRA
jgi:very-short-patch-repair endonuclease